MTKDQAIQILKKADLLGGCTGGSCEGEYAAYRTGDDEAELDGRFTADQLEAIAIIMRLPS